ncbi:hypothetical protein J1614_000455 [Plenodomus biglobosus]|nr:hypothetical protein J1614_000455 [Plenodomus biglobosus]
MSNLLDFPPTTLPPNARSPPYIVFAICSIDVVHELPSQIPLNAALHFIPKLKDWILPTPSTATLPKRLARVALRSPFVGINIQSDGVSAVGLKWVMKKVLQVSGLAHPKTLFLTQPSVGVAVAIYRTWIALELPIAGIANLLTHIQSRLMIGPPVANWEMNIIWHSFPHDSAITREMGMNSIRAHLNCEYAPSDTASLLEWYMLDDERRRFIHSISPCFPDVLAEHEQRQATKAQGYKVGLNARDSMEVGKRESVNSSAKKKARDAVEKMNAMLGKNETRRVSPREMRERHREDSKALQARLNRTRSDASIRSVETAIWDPPQSSRQTASNGASDNESPSLLAKLSIAPQAQEAEHNGMEARGRGRQRTWKDPVPLLSAKELAEVDSALQFSPTTTTSSPSMHTQASRRRNPSTTSKAQSKSSNGSHSSPRSPASQSTDKSVAVAKEGDFVFSKFRALDLLKLRKAKTIRRNSGREGLDEAKRESGDSKTLFGHSPYRGPETTRETIGLRRSNTVVLRSGDDGFDDASSSKEMEGRTSGDGGQVD